MKLDLEQVADGLGFPEGPVAMSDGSVLFVDIKNETLSRAQPDGKVETVADLPGGPNGVAIGPDGAAYVCNNGGVYTFVYNEALKGVVPSPVRPNYKGGSIQRVDLETGEVKTLFPDAKLLAPDDIVFDMDGGFWFTDSGIQDEETAQNGGVYYATMDYDAKEGKSLTRATVMAMPNGCGLSPDGKTLYVSDTLAGRLWALDIEGPGKVTQGILEVMPGRVVQTLPCFDLAPNARLIQWVDSLKVEAGGRVCVGTIFNGGITVFDPDGTTEHLAVPDAFTTNLCFGGADMKDVWITASSTGKIYKTRWERPGLKLAFNA